MPVKVTRQSSKKPNKKPNINPVFAADPGPYCHNCRHCKVIKHPNKPQFDAIMCSEPIISGGLVGGLMFQGNDACSEYDPFRPNPNFQLFEAEP